MGEGGWGLEGEWDEGDRVEVGKVVEEDEEDEGVEVGWCEKGGDGEIEGCDKVCGGCVENDGEKEEG